jgi:hypothetical protein
MERGPLALFAAIIAVGLGPALWLGAQLAVVGTLPIAPPPVSAEYDTAETARPGTGSKPSRGSPPLADTDTDTAAKPRYVPAGPPAHRPGGSGGGVPSVPPPPPPTSAPPKPGPEPEPSKSASPEPQTSSAPTGPDGPTPQPDGPQTSGPAVSAAPAPLLAVRRAAAGARL